LNYIRFGAYPRILSYTTENYMRYSLGKNGVVHP
jgi:hypothetical protein